MLTRIHIRDYAIIDSLELELDGGMTVLTGETGAGKSILVDALGLVLGDRADTAVVRPGAERADITAVFTIASHPQALAWLREHDLDAGEECQLRRVVSSDGKSKGYINGRPAPVQSLKEIGEHLVDIHGQHQHQSLLRPDVQRQLLDDFAANNALASEVAQLAQAWKATHRQLDELRGAADDRQLRLELLSHHVEELRQLAPRTGEFAQLEDEHRRLANGGQLLDTCASTLAVLENDDDNLIDRLHPQLQALAGLGNIDSRLANVCVMLDEAGIRLREAATELRDFLDGLELDPERLAQVEQRLGALIDCARKHRVEPAALPELALRLEDELQALQSADIQLDTLQHQLEQQASAWREQAHTLSQQRHAAAQRLSQQVTQLIHGLGMPGGRFQITLSPRADTTPHPHGLDQIGFEISANPGQPLRPLGKVASGGELSRIALAIEVSTVASQPIPTLIFDEVDTGIGGAVAETVGRQLRTLGGQHQVLCVTHLPQVAALGHHHFKVEKTTVDTTTRTDIRRLASKQRQEEIARMLGGQEITAQTRAHAKEMIARAEAG